MALQNNLLNPANPDLNLSAYRGTGGQTRKVSILLADLVALGAFTSGDVILMNLPPKALILRTIVKPVTAVTGVGTAVGYVKTATNTYGLTTFDLKAAVSATNANVGFNSSTTAGLKESFAADVPLLFHVIVDTTCDAITAGAVDVTVTYDVLP